MLPMHARINPHKKIQTMQRWTRELVKIVTFACPKKSHIRLSDFQWARNLSMLVQQVSVFFVLRSKISQKKPTHASHRASSSLTIACPFLCASSSGKCPPS
uniref:Uncharacterized protein n=1 Tax=Percolomonas cosmopolitus TaxID=63605 RepID=A0A7S1KPW7_9EUKA|mmetsp:Transcript_447/g.1682  ORF Transcript_447/g.1682 Transcript_447/m.1682 type:complete len:101 (+) Transcript_447:90-392(+)